MYKIKRTPAVYQDLAHIAQYTLDTWGLAQARNYMLELETSIDLLRRKPETAGKNRGDIEFGLRSLSHRHQYYILYRVSGRTVELLRIVHQRRDLAKALADR